MNSFGNNFRVAIFGESHGSSIGVVIDGVPSAIPISVDDFTADLKRRAGGKVGTTSRKEDDIPTILSGIYNGYSTGAPIAITFKNGNIRPQDYSSTRHIPRPGHADFVSIKKYGGFADMRGGGHFSGRVTLALVAAGVIAKKIIDPIQIESKILKIGGESSPEKWDYIVESAFREGDSVGGEIECTATSVPIGVGEPFFNSLESLISHLIFSIPGIRGVEFGDGFASAKMRGSEHNDPIINSLGKTSKNGSGGINGGISNGNNIVLRAAVKPTSSISKAQQTYNFQRENIDTIETTGRHDSCIALRIPVIIEAAVAIAIADSLTTY